MSTPSPSPSLSVFPDCLQCLRTKLRATGIVVFYQFDYGWEVVDHQSNKPMTEAEIECYCLLENRVPETLSAHPEGILSLNDHETQALLPGVSQLLRGQAVIGAPIQKGELRGARIAWRNAREPFGPADLELIRCLGVCPEDCCGKTL